MSHILGDFCKPYLMSIGSCLYASRSPPPIRVAVYSSQCVCILPSLENSSQYLFNTLPSFLSFLLPSSLFFLFLHNLTFLSLICLWLYVLSVSQHNSYFSYMHTFSVILFFSNLFFSIQFYESFSYDVCVISFLIIYVYTPSCSLYIHLITSFPSLSSKLFYSFSHVDDCVLPSSQHITSFFFMHIFAPLLCSLLPSLPSPS